MSAVRATPLGVEIEVTDSRGEPLRIANGAPRIATTIRIDPEFRDLIPPLSPEELAQLEASILLEGVRDPVVVWAEAGLLVDGHNRHAICVEHGLECPIVTRSFADRDAAKRWMLANQLGRRNLTPEGAAYLRGQLVRAHGRPQGRPRKDDSVSCFSLATLAKEQGVSERTLQRDADFAAALNKASPEFRAAVVGRTTAKPITREEVQRVAGNPSAERALLARKNRANISETENHDGDSWCTPKEWIDRARAVMGGIDLDPATNPTGQSIVQAAKFFTKDDDGLSREWRGRVWLNPPYSQPLVTQFTRKLISELDAGRVTEAIVLVNNASDAVFWHTLAKRSSAIAHPVGRVPFVHPLSRESFATRQGQTVFYFGARNIERFEKVFGECCFVVVVTEPV